MTRSVLNFLYSRWTCSCKFYHHSQLRIFYNIIYMIWFNHGFLKKGLPFGQDCVFPWNLSCVPFGHDEFLAWNSFSQPWFMHNDGIGLISLMVYLAKSSQLTCGSDLSSKIGLLRACIRSDLSYINEYEFRPQGVQTWLRLIKMLGSFS
jgi:hypothetical protein